jgi:trk system potassium uptake protein TrkA
MRIVIAGAGLVGRGLARRLSVNRHDVTVVESDREICEQVYSELGVQTICGSATSIATLEEAELGRANCAAAAMRRDSDNLCFALLAKHMGVSRIIVRMRDPRYEQAYRLAGVTRALDSVELYLNEFVWEIEEAAIKEVTAFGEGRARIVSVRVPEGSKAAGRTVGELTQQAGFPADCVIIGLLRPATGEFILRRAQVTIQSGDHVYLAAYMDDMPKATRHLTAQ